MVSKYYVVHRGVKKGIYNTWDECRVNTTGIKGSIFKSFSVKKDAESFLKYGNGMGKQTFIMNTMSSKPKPNDLTPIDVYTDGSCDNVGCYNAKGGYGVFFDNYKRSPISEPLQKDCNQTANYAELYAIYHAMTVLKNESRQINIYTDSEYAIKSLTTSGEKLFNSWVSYKDIKKYQSNYNKTPNWQLVVNAYKLYNESNNITVHKVKAHSGISGNEEADRLAGLGAKK